ncbi:MAG TPA: hypothetical protein VFP50_18830 [Anaeromyxobacteraceae bacterium]|nr:hypothetical protein [Anaeromyxobacteraceae bacterium]
MKTHPFAARGLRPWLAIGAFAAATCFSAYLAYPTVFTGTAAYDDEGYLLASFRSFLRLGGLYSSTYTNYGPGYYAVLGTIFRVTGADLLSLGPGRITALALLVGGSLAGAVAVWLATRRLLVAVAAQLFFVGLLKAAAAAEPLHPGGYLVFLLGLLTLTAFLRERLGAARTAGALGIIVALMLSTKVNVGAFALIGCALAASAGSRSPRLRGAALAVIVALPLALTSSQWRQEGVLAFALVIALGGLASLVVIGTGPALPVGRRETASFVGWCVAVGVLVCIPVVASGTPPWQLLDGALIAPARFPGTFYIPAPLDLSESALPLCFALLLAGAAVVARRAFQDPVASRLVGFVKIVGGVQLIALFGPALRAGAALPAMLVLAALLAVPLGSWSEDAIHSRRILLVVGVLQPLHWFPVAGSQVAWGSFLLALIAFVNVGDGISELAPAVAELPAKPPWGRALPAAAGLLLIGAVALRADLWPWAAYARFDSLAELQLPGAAGIRVPPVQAAQVTEIARVLGSSCDSFYSIPGLGSFYPWTRMQAPTGRIVTAWPLLFDDDMQAAAIRDLDRFQGRLCVLANPAQLGFWLQGRPLRFGPLVRYLSAFSEEIGRAGDYVVLRRPTLP